jgi:hypothetical protein
VLVADKTRKPGKVPIAEEVKNKIGTTGCREKPENATDGSTRSRAVEEELTGVVGLYLNPPDKALVLCIDEKSQIPA